MPKISSLQLPPGNLVQSHVYHLATLFALEAGTSLGYGFGELTSSNTPHILPNVSTGPEVT